MGKIKYAAFSECGIRRDNEDYCKVVEDSKNNRYLFVVCDGMGGHAMGEVASQVVGSAICEYWEQASFEEGVEPVLQTSFKLASDALDAKANVLHKVEMGTTLVLAAIDSNQLYIAHSGDSRAYLLQNGEVAYQTKDHVEHSVWGDFINRSFFSYQREKADVEIHQFELNPGDRILLCSDGVCQFIAPDILTRRSMDDKSPEDVIDVILFLCEKFSKDNYSAILVYYE
jgi:protein phosphatase